MVLQEPSLIFLFALFMSVGDITNRMRQIPGEVQHQKYVPCSHSGPPLANLILSLDSHTPLGIRKLTSFNFKSDTLKIQVGY